MTLRSAAIAGLLVLFPVLSSAPLTAEDATLVEAQGLYESARYEQALDVLDALDPADAASLEERQSIRRYRALCLIALDRPTDAERPIEEMVRAEPAALAGGDLPPRLKNLLQQVRLRVVPAIVREGYERGRDLYERREFAGADAELTTVIALIDDPAVGLARDPAFADVRLLADGFLRLAKAAPPPVAADTAAAEPVFAPPRPLVQTIPPFPHLTGIGFLAGREGELELEIGADGSVHAAKMLVSIHPAYDLLLAATARRDWKYEPARRNGVAVPSRINMRVVLNTP